MLKDRIEGLITQIALAETEGWFQIYAHQGANGRKPRTNEIVALANLSSARSHLMTALQHINGQERMDNAEAGKG